MEAREKDVWGLVFLSVEGYDVGCMTSSGSIHAATIHQVAPGTIQSIANYFFQLH